MEMEGMDDCKGTWETFRGNRNVLYPDCSGGYIVGHTVFYIKGCSIVYVSMKFIIKT